MGKAVAFLVLAELTYLFVFQKKSEPPAAPEQVVTLTTPARATSEHDWAKHALDRTAQAKQDVLRQRASEESP